MTRIQQKQKLHLLLLYHTLQQNMIPFILVLCNFQDVFLQKSQSCGPLWCDEGVYRLVKELELLDPARFDNIFLGLGGFHTEKVMIITFVEYVEWQLFQKFYTAYFLVSS